MPLNVSEEQEQGRMDWRTHMLRKFDGGRSPRVTGDDTWVYQYNPETKQQSAVWILPDDNPLVTERRLRLTGMSTTVCLKSSRHGASGVPERVSVVHCSIMTMPTSTQQL